MSRPRGSSQAVSEESKARRAEILATATRLFERQGFRGTSTRQVAETLGVTKPVLYHYFPSKDALLEHVYRHVTESVLDSLDKIRASDVPACEKLLAVVRNYVSYHLEHRAFLTIFWRERHELPPAMQAAVRLSQVTIGNSVMAILESGVAEGCFRPSLDIKLGRNVVLGLLTSVYRWGNKTEWNEAELVTGISDILFPGLLLQHSHG